MKASRIPCIPYLFGLLLFALTLRGMGAVTFQASINPPEVNVGDEVTVTFTAKGGSVGQIQLPPVDGLSVQGYRSRLVSDGFDLTQSTAFIVVPTRAGNFTIPSFAVHSNGQDFHTPALKLHVLGTGAMTSPSPAPAAPQNSGPVVMPPATPDATAPSSDGSGANGTISVPTEPDGRPARVFHIITPQTTDAYVGESVPLKIQFYIRADSNAQQNSLPTLIGSDFLMNNLSLRPMQEGVGISDYEYIRDTWITAISAPKAGDFPLEATRDTYWSTGINSNDPFGGLFGRASKLMHKEIGSNKIVIHVHPLPEEGKPDTFTGAIGKFHVSGSAGPAVVNVGEPVTLHFTVSGAGNFDYVRSPALARDPAWKSYVATSKVSYEDESHTQATKTFEQAVIPLKNGKLSLPTASFSYFDPDAKHYVIIPLTLPSITVNGTVSEAVTTPTAPSAEASDSAPSPSPKTEFVSNRLAFGALTADLAPSYAHAWFWIVQALFLILIVLGILLVVVRSRRDTGREERALRDASLHQQEDAMGRAAREGDAEKFFTSARHVVQLQLAERWHVSPTALTIAEIQRRDPALGETLFPLFIEADNVIYSGAMPAGIDLMEWDRRVREMLQPARL